MTVDLSVLDQHHRVLLSIPLRPAQGHRFQPTGFPSLGAATYQTASGLCLLVESAQSMANRLEAAVWDDGAQRPVPALEGLSHVTVTRKGAFFTDTMLEAHRLNSPYLLEGKDDRFKKELKGELGELGEGPVNRRKLAAGVLKYDAGSLVHGVFLAKKDLAGGRLRVTRALSAFIEAEGVRVAASGGVKNDHVNPSGETKAGYGNVPFSRDELTADRITLHVSLDLAMLRGYGLPDGAVRMLVLLSLYKVARLVEGGLRLRTACDLVRAADGPIAATRPAGWVLPGAADIEPALQRSIAEQRDAMRVTKVAYEDELRKSKAEDGDAGEEENGEQA